MLKEFWEAKKHLIQLIGILTGVGALFLSIKPSDNATANNALANIQFVWLIIITVSSIILFINFAKLGIEWEDNLKIKRGFDLTETISFFVLATLVYLLLNLWIYIINLYKNSFWDFFTITNGAIFSFIGAIFYHYWRRVLFRIPEAPMWKRITCSFFAHIPLSIVAGFFTEIVTSKGGFSLIDGLKISIFFFLLFFPIFSIVYEIRRKKEVKN